MLLVIIIVTMKIKPNQIVGKTTDVYVVQILNIVDSRDTPKAGIIKLSSYFEGE